MSAVHDRWGLVEPLLFGHILRDPRAFREGVTTRSFGDDLAALKREHRFDEAAIARAMGALAAEPVRPESEPLYAHIQTTSSRWLELDGDHWALRLDAHNPGHEIVRWRGITMLLPPSIVIAGALAETDGSYPCRVEVLPSSIAPISPVAHMHVHLGPMLAFETLWLELWNAFLQHRTLDSRHGNGIASIKGAQVPEIARHTNRRQPGILWQWTLELAFAARVWLELPDKTPLPPMLEAFSRGRIDVARRGSALLTLQRDEHWRNEANRVARKLKRARDREDREAKKKKRAAAKVARCDPDGPARPPPACPGGTITSNEADDEIVFLAKALRRCRHPPAYARVFYQYLRVKVALYRQLVVDPWTTGLAHFLEVVKRDTPYLETIDDDGRVDAMRLGRALAEKPLQIDALEIHVPPARWIKQRHRAPSPHAWILSFVRARGPKTKLEKGAKTDGWVPATWRRVRAASGATCRHLARAMAKRPSVLRDLRGLSVMDAERNGPAWLFEAHFRKLLDASATIAAGHPRLGLSPLRTALHLGEDFDHLLSGLRQIFEPFEWGLIGRGDRIGHALALGLSPKAWCQDAPWVRMRRWDRILDVGFVYWAFEKLALELPSNTLARLRVDASDALQHVFGGARSASALENARDLWCVLPRRAPRMTRGAGLPDDGLVEARGLLARILDDRSVGRRAFETFAVETGHDLPLLAAVHDLVHARLANSHVAIEVNPSSNLLVGGFRSIFQQPAFHSDDLPITINADDPLNFATSLADEYAYAWAGMVIGSGEKPHHATRRIEEAARCSVRYRFTPQAASAGPETRRRGT